MLPTVKMMAKAADMSLSAVAASPTRFIRHAFDVQAILLTAPYARAQEQCVNQLQAVVGCRCCCCRCCHRNNRRCCSLLLLLQVATPGCSGAVHHATSPSSPATFQQQLLHPPLRRALATQVSSLWTVRMTCCWTILMSTPSHPPHVLVLIETTPLLYCGVFAAGANTLLLNSF
jgi:hypothetical protein